eukprot:576786-Amorphochlora_amoeboformis.AAC.1
MKPSGLWDYHSYWTKIQKLRCIWKKTRRKRHTLSQLFSLLSFQELVLSYSREQSLPDVICE